jgi:hypothetical protein
MLPSVLPDYLVDRFAFRLHRRDAHGITTADRFAGDLETLASGWEAATVEALTGVPSAGLPALVPDDPIPASSLREDLLRRWRTFLTVSGVPRVEHRFADPAGSTWRALLSRSVLYPFFQPAICGPDYFERLTPEQRDDVVRRHGRDGIVALYAFLLQAHEETHEIQCGEPMLCEYALAWLWCRFLTIEDLWYWQQNARTQRRFNQEAAWVQRVRLGVADVAALCDDTAGGVARVAGADIYDDCCLAAWMFDAGRLRYREYLDLVTALLERRHDAAAAAAARRRLDVMGRA